MKTLTMAVLTASLAVTSIAPSAYAQQAPSYLQGIDAIPLDDQEMESIRGEAVPAVVIAFVARRVGIAIGAWAAVKITDMLQRKRLPTYAEYRAAFGTRTAIVLSILPSYLRPNIAQ